MIRCTLSGVNQANREKKIIKGNELAKTYSEYLSFVKELVKEYIKCLRWHPQEI